MKKAGFEGAESKITWWMFLFFMLFLLISTPTKENSQVDEISPFDEDFLFNLDPKAERITYAPKVNPGGGKTLNGPYPLSGYDYQERIQINITNNVNEELPAGYSVSFSINTWFLTNKGELQADGDDLRIGYNSSGTWFELNRVNTTAFNTFKTQIWFQTYNAIGANSFDANYWIFYANPGVSNPPNNPEYVFLFFDDFDNGETTGWTAKSGSWWLEQYPTDSDNYVLRGSNNTYFYKTSGSYGNVSISALIRWDGGDRRRGVAVRYNESDSNSYQLLMNRFEDGIELRRRQLLENNTSTFPSGLNYNGNNWYRYEIAAQTINNDDVWVRGRIYDNNMTLRAELTNLDDSSTTLYLENKIALYGEGWFDDVILRQFVNPEPTIELSSPLGTNLMLLTNDATDLNFGGGYLYSKNISINHTKVQPAWYYKNITINHAKVQPTWYYKNITIDYMQVADNLTNFPLLIDLYDTDLQDDTQADGSDIWFQDSAGNRLDHEIEVYKPIFNATHAHLVAWVRTNLSDSSDTVISMFYGYPTVGSQANPTGVWDANYKGVWHLSEDPTGTIYDSTANNHDGTSQGSMTSGDQVAGQVDGSLDFDGTNDYITTTSNELITANNFTISLWFKADTTNFAHHLVWEGDGAGNGWGAGTQLVQEMHISFGDIPAAGGTTNDVLTFFLGDTDLYYTTDQLTVNTPFTDTTNWHHVTVVVSGMSFNPTVTMYLDGVSVGTDWGTSIGTNRTEWDTAFRIGSPGGPERYYDGMLDEIRVSNINRSTAWIATEYNNQNNPTSFYSVGSEQETGGQQETGGLTNFPVLIDLYDIDLQDDAQANGEDIRFQDAGGDRLDHEIELYNQNYNTTHARLVAWVRTNVSDFSDTIISMYYGGSMGSQANPEGVWENNFDGVWHLRESSGSAVDSTGNNDGTFQGSLPDSRDAQIGRGQDFDGSGDSIDITLPTALSDISDNNFTISLYFNSDDLGAYGTWIRFFDARDSAGDFVQLTTYDNPGEIYFHVSIGGSRYHRLSNLVLSENTWYYIVLTWDASTNTPKMYINGSPDYDRDEGSFTGAGNQVRLRIGARTDGNFGTYYEGMIDEFRVSNNIRSAGWIATEYNNQNDPASFYSVGSEQESRGLMLTNFPLLIDLYDTDLQDDAQADGEDIRFVDAAGNQLDHEIEAYEPNYNATHAHLIAWIRTNVSDSSDTVISMYYGHHTVGSQTNPTGVWENNYDGVWHLRENSGFAVDSTGNNDGTFQGSLPDARDAQIGRGQDFDGSGDSIDIALPTALSDISDNNFTISLYFNSDDLGASFPLIRFFDARDSAGDYVQLTTYNNPGEIHFHVYIGGSRYRRVSNLTLSENTWYYIVLTWDTNTNTPKMYINGSPDYDRDEGVNISAGNQVRLRIGARTDGDSGTYYEGMIDEFRVSNVIRSAEWIATEYNNQNDPASFYSVGSEQDHYSNLNNDYKQTNVPFYNHITQDLGYVVDYHGHENQGSADTPFFLEGYDAVLLSLAVDDAWTISLSNETIPILTWEYETCDELYLGEAGSNNTSTDIYVVNTSHFITKDQLLASVNIYSVSAPMGYLVDYDPPPVGSEIEILATNGSDFTSRLLALEKGAVDYNPPHKAPERRVFWSGHNGSALNTDGWALFDRALHWTLYLEAVFAAPIIEAGGTVSLPSEDGILQFWFNAIDVFPGIDFDSGLVNITAINTVGAGIYPMVYNGTHFIVEVSLPYWNITGVQRNSFSYNFTVSDLSGLSMTGGGAYGINVPDIVAPRLVDYGVEYETPYYSIWCNTIDGTNGSGIDTSSPSVNVSYKIIHNNTWFGPFEMQWNSTSSYWEYTLSGITGADVFLYNFTARDRAEPTHNYVDNKGDPGYCDPSDTEPPVISAYSHDYFGNGTVRIWANVLDLPGYSGINVKSVNLKYNSTIDPIPQIESMIRYNDTFWEWYHYFSWNQTLSPYAINYTIASCIDMSGHENISLANQWDLQHSYVTYDLEPPEITTAGFDAVHDVNGHFCFWADIRDSYSGLNTSRIFINIALSSGDSFNNSMINNGTYFVYDTNIAYWNDTTHSTRMSLMYNVTVFDNVGLSAIPNIGGPTSIPDEVPPELYTGVQDFHNGSVTIWAETSDGIYGSGFPITNDSVLLTYRKNGIGPFTNQMNWNGTGNWYTYTFQNLLAGDILQYYIQVMDVTLNTRTSPSYMYGIADETPPMIHDSGHEFIPDMDGHIRFWANVSEDIGAIMEVKVEGSPFLFNGIMTFNQTYYIYDLYANSGTIFSYNITARNLAYLISQTASRSDIIIDIVPPPTQNFLIVNEKDNQDGTVKFWVSVTDGIRGSGINPSNVYFIYRFGLSGWQTKQMIQDGSNYVSTVGDRNDPKNGVSVGDVIEYYVRATDNAGNMGEGPRRIFGVIDRTDPQIHEIGYEYLNDTDGHIRFWCYANDTFGTIGKATVKITGDQNESGTMIWIGDYFYYDTNLAYGNSFNFEVTVLDTAHNEASQSKSGHTVQDTVPPRIMAADGVEFQNGTVILWANVTDGKYGSGFPSACNTVNITYQLNAGFPKTVQMVWNPSESRYEHIINDLRVGDILDFFILATDIVGNANTRTIIAHKFAVPDTTPPQIHACGYSLLPADDGLVQFWVNASDPFGTINKVLLNITIDKMAVKGKSTSVSLGMDSVKEVEMGHLNATYWAYETNLGYQTHFSYSIIVIDGADQKSEPGGASGQIVGDGAPPRVTNAEIIDSGNELITIWARVEEEGSGVEILEVVYSIDDGKVWERATMEEFNTTHYVSHMEVEVGSSILWVIATKDLEGNVDDSAWNVWENIPYRIQNGFPLRYLVGIIAAAAATTIIAIKIFSLKRRQRSLKAQKQMILESIMDITNFFDLLVITPGGLPFYTFLGIDSRQSQDSTMYSSFLIALKSFSAEFLFDYDTLINENHFKFGRNEIILYDIRELTFAYMFSAQMRDGIWKKVSDRVLERTKELSIRIADNFQDAIHEFQSRLRTSVNPDPVISEMVIEGLVLDYILPHHIIDLEVHIGDGIPEESTIIQTIEQVNAEDGTVSLFQVLEKLKFSDITTEDILFVFHQLREEGAIASILRKRRREDLSIDEERIDVEREVEVRGVELSPEEHRQEIRSITLNPKEIISLCKKLHFLVTTQSDDEAIES